MSVFVIFAMLVLAVAVRVWAYREFSKLSAEEQRAYTLARVRSAYY